MFFGSDREELVREMFIAGELARREREAEDSGIQGDATQKFARALERLGELQRGDFVEIFRAMRGLPVTIRLLDPPIHEFIEVARFERDLAEAERADDADAIEGARTRLQIARDLEETNPMLGTRGARLGLRLPDVYEMQARAVVEAALEVSAGGDPPEVEIMLPLIAYESELVALRELVDRAVQSTLENQGGRIEVEIGTMIELPQGLPGRRRDRGARRVLQLRHERPHPDGARFLSRRCRAWLLAPVPIPGAGRAEPVRDDRHRRGGELVKTAAQRGRATKPGLKLGICGEHGGDPASIEFFHAAGLDYVSCSPYRVPIARVAAARAAIG